MKKKLWQPSRRSLIIAAPAIIASRKAAAGFGIFQVGSGSAFPGQPGNPVGFAVIGPVGTSTSTTLQDNTRYIGGDYNSTTGTANATYTSIDFDPFLGTSIPSGAQGLVLSASNNVTFKGCRFQAFSTNAPSPATGNGGYAVRIVNGASVTFKYCTFCPRVATTPTPPQGIVWPSNGAGQSIDYSSSNYTSYMIPMIQSFEYGVKCNDDANNGGPIIFDHCDFWGMGNSLTMQPTTSATTIRDCWFHDLTAWGNIPAYNPATHYSFNDTVVQQPTVDDRLFFSIVAGAGTNTGNNPATSPTQWALSAANTGFHTDGPGYLNTTATVSNVIIDHCTIASIGSTNGIALQQAVSGYNNITVTNNFLAGFGVLLDLGHITPANSNTNMTVIGNTIGTDLVWSTNIMTSQSGDFTHVTNPTNVWRNNKFKVLAGTTNYRPSSPAWTAANDGYYVWPDGTLNSPGVGDWPN